MAKTPKTPTKTETAEAQEKAVAALQASMDRACAVIADGSSALLRRTARAARAGVPRATVDRAIAALESAVADLKAGTARAYETPTARPVRASRVNLAGDDE